MKIVIDTNVLISGLFFGGYPGQVLKYVCDGYFTSCISKDILKEYNDTLEKLAEKYEMINKTMLKPFLKEALLIEQKSALKVCRDSDDDKFINCAIDAKAVYVVSGDDDLISLKEIKGIEIITARDFCNKIILLLENTKKILS